MTTTNLLIPLIETNQSQKEVTANEAIQLLEDKAVETQTIAVADGANSVTSAQFRQAAHLSLAGSPTAGFTLELPAIKGMVIVTNASGQEATINVAGDLATVAIANAATALLYNTGTTIVNVAGVSSSGATVFTQLTDAPSSYDGMSGKRVSVKSDETGLEFTAPPEQIPIDQRFANYTLVTGDANRMQALDSASPVTLTVAAMADAIIPIGSRVYVLQLGAGQVTIAPDTGVTIYSRGTFKTHSQYATVTLTKVDTDVWILDGSLGASATDTFVGQSDTPADYTGAANKLLAVNSGGTAVEFKSAREIGIERNAQTGTTYTLVLADAGKLVTLDNASAITLTVPTNASVAFPIGTQILLGQLGAGQVTVAGDTGVTVNTPETLKLRKQYAQAALVKIGTDEWLLEGNLEAA